MLDLEFLNIFVLPIIVFFIPLFYTVIRFRRSKRELLISISQSFRFLLFWLIFSIVMLTFLLYLTGGILTGLFRLERGYEVTDKEIGWNITEHTRILFLFDPGIGLLVIALMLGLLYSSLLFLPKFWIIIDQNQIDFQAETKAISTSATSSLSSTLSALSSTAVCCTTSTVSIIIPSLTAFLGPLIPVLMIISYVTIEYSLLQLITSRIPLTKISEIE